MKRDPSVMIYGLITNILVMAVFYYGLYQEYSWNEYDGGHEVIFPKFHNALLISSGILLTLMIPFYILSIVLNPGYIKPKYDFIKLVEKALDYDEHLDNFCSYCETIKT